MLLADKNSDAWDFSNKVKDYIEKEKNDKIALNEVKIDTFRNGELDVHVPENLRGQSVYFIQDSNKNPQDWWVEQLLIGDLLNNSSAKEVNYVLPNMLYSRKDRKDKPHVPISARALANSISTYLNRLITLDMHAEQTQSAYPSSLPIDSLQSAPYVAKYLSKNHSSFLENLVVVSPDAGGVDRVENFCRHLERETGMKDTGHHYDVAFMSKYRSDGEIEKVRLTGDVEGKNALILDDIIDSGSTQKNAAEKVKKEGAKDIKCYGTHGLFTKGVDNIKDYFSSIMTSNTHYQKNGDVEVIDMSPLFAEAIHRNHYNQSISKLFK